MFSTPIDAVITWVDGSDPVHRKKREKYSSRVDSTDIVSTGMLETRFNQVDEVKYCIYSIRKYAAWIRTIYLVTDNQIPDWLTKEKMEELGVTVIDHKEIFREHPDCLPTFNSRSIETVLWRIPELSNCHIYFNDDFFLIDHVELSDFFADGKIKLRGRWKVKGPAFLYRLYDHLRGFLFNKQNKNKGPLAKRKAASLAGFTFKYFDLPHIPHPMRIDLQKEFYEQNSSESRNIRYRFRHADQFLPTSLVAHLALKAQRAEPIGEAEVAYISIDKHSFDEMKATMAKVKKGEKRFLCIQALDKADEEVFTYLDSALQERIMK